jgi:hypothetical protein
MINMSALARLSAEHRESMRKLKTATPEQAKQARRNVWGSWWAIVNAILVLFR